MREIRTYGSEGGEPGNWAGFSYPYRLAERSSCAFELTVDGAAWSVLLFRN